jgi:hypothetical protein
LYGVSYEAFTTRRAGIVEHSMHSRHSRELEYDWAKRRASA